MLSEGLRWGPSSQQTALITAELLQALVDDIAATWRTSRQKAEMTENQQGSSNNKSRRVNQVSTVVRVTKLLEQSNTTDTRFLDFRKTSGQVCPGAFMEKCLLGVHSKESC